MFRDAVLAATVKGLRRLIRIVRGRGGAALPGVIIKRLAPGYLSRTLRALSPQMIIVTGSSGKSTTARMITDVLTAHGHRVFLNRSTANIEQGLITALLEATTWRGEFPYDICVLEMDEAHAFALRETVSPRGVVATNVMADQINRFSDAGVVADMVAQVACRASQWIVTNANDGLLLQRLHAISPRAAIHTVSVSNDIRPSHNPDMGLLIWREDNEASCRVIASDSDQATLILDGEQVVARPPAPGPHNAVNSAMAVLAAKTDQGPRWQAARATQAISAMPTVFARNEVSVVSGQPIRFLLVQNTGSLQLNLDELGGQPDCFMFALGNDVTDFSYFWPAVPKGLSRVDIVTGQKAPDAALYFGYLGVTANHVTTDYEEALRTFLELPIPSSGHKTVMFTADAMRRIRAIWGLS